MMLQNTEKTILKKLELMIEKGEKDLKDWLLRFQLLAYGERKIKGEPKPIMPLLERLKKEHLIVSLA